jgi:hypothetical protein
MPAPRDLCRTHYCQSCAAINDALAQQVLALEHSDIATRTHLFAGRYENVYIPPDRLEHINLILDHALELAADILNEDREELALGFWFNIMRQGDITLPHTHDDYDELLSGTYYIKVPDTDSRLTLSINNQKHSVEPREGMFVLFHPATLHEVSENPSPEPRISIGFNIGCKKNQQSSL